MRELKWSLRSLRSFFVLIVGIATLILLMVNRATNGKNLFEVGYRMMFVVLQLIMCVLLSERFHVVLRRSIYHRFYRSMPKAWEKERCRFLWIDGFFFVCAVAVFAIGAMFRNELADGTVPTLLLLIFLAHAVVAKVLAILPFWLWWIQELVFAAMFFCVPLETIPVSVGIGAVGAYIIIQFFLYRMFKKYWYMEE